MRKWIVRVIAAVVLLYFVAGLFVLPYVIRTKVPEVVRQQTGGNLQIDSVAFNPLIFSLELKGVRLLSPQNDPLFSLRRFYIDVDVVPLMWGAVSVEHIGLYGPSLSIAQDEQGIFNFAWLMPKEKAGDVNGTETEADANGTLPRLVLKRFELEDGAVTFSDRSRAQPLQLSLAPIALTLNDIDTADVRANRIHFSAGTGNGGVLDVKSRLLAFNPPVVQGHVDYKAGKLYLAYQFLQQLSALELADGRIHAALDFDVNLSDLNATAVDDINVSLKRLRVISKASHADVVRVGNLHVAAGPVLPLQQRADVQKVSLDDLYFAAVRLADGTIDWQHFFPVKEEVHQDTVEQNESRPQQSAAWDAKIAATQLHNLQVRFEDRTLPAPAVLSINDFNLSLTPVSTDLGIPVGFAGAFGVNRKGMVEFNGSVVPEPLAARADVKIDRLQLSPFNPYVQAQSYADVQRGSITMDSRIAFAPSAEHPDLAAQGRFALNDLLVTDTRDAMPLISMGAFKVDPYLFEWQPNRLFVDTATLDAFYANILVDRNKTLNLATLMRPKQTESNISSKPAADTAEQNSSFPVRIVRFEVKNGAVHFKDASLPLPFDTQIHDVNGEVLNISTLPEDTTYLKIDGEIDRYGTARAEGSLNTGAPKRFSDIRVAFRNIELPSYTPYSGKFVGRAIDNGKLSVTLRYRINNSAMHGDNSLVINRIEMGREIESNSSVSLPLDFAIALLEDSDGVIDIDMPVEGDVDNPDFKWGGVVWNAFVNLLTKAVTAPFDLIGSMLGIEGDELKSVPFEAGSAAVDAVARERLDLLAKALAKRPKLGISVAGTYDSKQDKEALQRQALRAQVLGTDDKKSIGAGDALVPGLLEPIYIERLGEEALDTLKASVAESDASEEEKARTYTEALLKALIETQPLPDDALQTLAKQRARAIRSYLTLNHGIDAGRITEVEPKSAEANDGYIASEVTLDVAR